MARLPVDERGFLVPWFVATIDGKPDFRVVRENGILIAIKSGTCWLCGEKLGRYQAYVIGPMCGVNRTTSEPPCHRECAEYAARACPFLTRPMAVRNERNMPEHQDPAGHMIKRNPGCALVWVQKTPPRLFTVENGFLFRLDDPSEVTFWARGRKATLDEVRASVHSGMPILAEMAEKDGPEGVAALNRQAARFGAMLREAFA
jgi:hypothetical protein